MGRWPSHGGTVTLDILSGVAKRMGVQAVEGCSMITLLKDGDEIEFGSVKVWFIVERPDDPTTLTL